MLNGFLLSIIARHQARYCHISVSLSNAGIVSKRCVSSNFVHRLVGPSLVFLHYIELRNCNGKGSVSQVGLEKFSA